VFFIFFYHDYIFFLFSELAIDPKELRFTTEGGLIKLNLANNTGTRLAIKVCHLFVTYFFCWTTHIFFIFRSNARTTICTAWIQSTRSSTRTPKLLWRCRASMAIRNLTSWPSSTLRLVTFFLTLFFFQSFISSFQAAADATDAQAVFKAAPPADKITTANVPMFVSWAREEWKLQSTRNNNWSHKFYCKL